MAAIVRSDRFYLGCGNLAGAIICLPLCWGLPSPDWAALKFASAFGAAALGTNAARLISQHSENAPVRAAWKESAITVDAAWIEQLAIANLPPTSRFQQREEQFASGGEYYLPQLPPPPQNFQSIAQENHQQSQPAEETPPERGGDRKMPNLSAYNAVLICGVPGSGKTTLAQREIQKRLDLGHEVIVLDPHAAYGAWQGCKIVGGSMDYKAIDLKLKWLFSEIKNRYSRQQNEPNPNFKPLTIVAEEFTQWSLKVKSSSEFFWTSNTDIRKVEIFVLFINHTRTLIAMGGAKGAAQLRDDNLLEIQLQGEMNEETGRATPLYQALVKMPGKPLSERFLVPIERTNGRVSTNPPQTSDSVPRSSVEGSLPEPETSRSTDRISGLDLEAILAQILNSGGNLTVYAWDWGLSNAERFELARLVIKRELGTEKRILYLWGVKSGGTNHYKYVEARKYLDRLIEEINK